MSAILSDTRPSPVDRLPLLRRLERDRRGSAAIIFAVSILPLVAAAGMAVDGLYAFSVRSQLASAVDAAALAGARSINDANRSGQIQQFFNANFSSSVPVDPLSIAVDSGAGTVSVAARARPQTSLMKLFGRADIPVAATSIAQIQGAGGMELSMVLDVTGSMKGSKLASLKRAGNNLLNALYKTNETVKNLSIAVVPFAGRVNIKPHRDWMTPANPFLWQYWWAGCADERTGSNAWDDSTITEEKLPEYKPGGSVLNAYEFCPPSSVLPLTPEKSKIKAVIDGLEAEGNTRTDIGMSWGWRTLSPLWRATWGSATAPADYDDPKIRKVVVMMTDGENTPSMSGDTLTEAQTYTQLLKVCDALKANGVIVYTIMFQAPSRVEPTYSACATTPEHHFVSVPTESELEKAFGRIGNDLANQNVRLIR